MGHRLRPVHPLSRGRRSHAPPPGAAAPGHDLPPSTGRGHRLDGGRPMSACISRHGEYSEHTPDGEYTCQRCYVLDEDALRVELRRLRAALATSRTRPTREQIDSVVGAVLFNAMNHPDPAAVLGKDIGPMRTKITDAVLALLADQPSPAETTTNREEPHG